MSAPAAPPAPAVAAAPRTPGAPAWLRVGVLAAGGLLLLVPLMVAWARVHLARDPGDAGEVARQFLRDVHAGGARDATRWVIPEGEAGVPAVASLPELRAELVRFDVGEVVLLPGRADANVPFTLRFDEGGTLPPRAPRDPETQRRVLQSARDLARKLDGTRGVVHLRRTSDGWRVRGLTFPAREDGRGTSHDLETLARAQAGQPRGGDPGPPVERLTPVAPEELESAGVCDSELGDRPARVALALLLDPVGLKVAWTPGGELGGALARPIPVPARGRRRLAVLDDLAREAGGHVEWQWPALRLAPGPAPWPSTWAGPFRVQVTRLQEHGSSATATLELQAVAAGLPEWPAWWLRNDQRRQPAAEVRSADGRDLLYPERSERFAPPAHFDGGDFPRGLVVRTWSVALKGLLADLDEVALVRGRLRVALPAGVERARLAPLEPDARARAGGVTFTLVGVEEVPAQTPPQQGPRGTLLRLRADGPPGRWLYWVARGDGGERLRAGWGDVLPWGLKLEVPGGTAALDLRVVTTRDVEYPYVLRHLPLRGRPPRALGPVSFPGHPAPVSVSWLGKETETGPPRSGVMPGGTPAAVLRFECTNYTEKAVEEMTLRLAYRDAESRTLKGESCTVPEGPYRYGVSDLVPPQGSATLNVTKAVPEGTQTIAVTVQRVLFVEGSVWPAKVSGPGAAPAGRRSSKPPRTAPR